MSSLVRLSRTSKIAALTAVGGSFYLFRDEIKNYLNINHKGSLSPRPSSEALHKKPIENLPERISYLLVGGGTASHSAMRAIRGHDPKAKVLIIGSEDHSPYMRPALSKELWFSDPELRRNLNFKWWNGKERSIYYDIDEFFIPIGDLEKRETGGVSIVKNMRLTHLDPENKVAHLENGQTIKYEKCMLAPGGRPKSLPVLDNATEEVKGRIVYFKTADDFLRLEKISATAKRIVILGGGFLGSELTCALSKRLVDEKKPSDQIIYQIFPETGNLGKVLPAYLSEWVSKKVANEGATIVPNVEVVSVVMSKDKSLEIKLTNGEIIQADYIVCAVGLEPDVDLAKKSCLEVDEKTGGYLVNSELEARTDVWVAGDASCFYDIKLGRRRVEHHDHAINSGRQAGQNMTGAGRPYSHQSMFWSDLGSDISFEAVGIVDSSLETVAVFTKQDEDNSENSAEDINQDKKVTDSIEIETRKLDKYDKGVVFYLKNDIIVGILLWNLFNRLNIARRILHEQQKYDDYNEVAKLFNIYLDQDGDNV